MFTAAPTWEAAEAANAGQAGPVIPAKWMVSATHPVGDIRSFCLSGFPDLEPISEPFRREAAGGRWRFMTPSPDGALSSAEGAAGEWASNDLYTEIEWPHEEWALFAWGCVDGWRLDVNNRQIAYEKRRKAPFFPCAFVRPLLLRKGVNRVCSRTMRRVGGNADCQFAVRPLGRRLALLHFLARAFPGEAARVAAAAVEFLGLNLATGKPAARRALRYPASPVREIRWRCGGRYGLVQAGRELYGLRPAPEPELGSFAAERRRAAAQDLPGPADQALVLRSLRLTEQALRDAGAVCVVDGPPVPVAVGMNKAGRAVLDDDGAGAVSRLEWGFGRGRLAME